MVDVLYSRIHTNQDIPDRSAAERTRAEHMQARGSSPSSAEPSTPYCNTGYEQPLTSQTPRKQPAPLSFRFDWYQATLPPEVEPLQVLRWASFVGESTPGKPMQGYEFCHDFGQLKVLYGGYTGKYGVHVIIHGGDACSELVDYLRLSFPQHRPSRIDVCLDFQGADAWDDLYQLVTLTAGRFGVKPRLYGDFINAETGRTIYLGTGNSTHKCRLYEKGHEQRAKKADSDAPLDWVRLEIQVHPTGPSRPSAASFTPDQVARSTKWTSFLCDTLRTVSAPTVSLSSRKKKPDCVDSFEHMCGQYAATVHKLKSEGYVSRRDFKKIVMAMYDNGTFDGLPQHVRRNWYF